MGEIKFENCRYIWRSFPNHIITEILVFATMFAFVSATSLLDEEGFILQDVLFSSIFLYAFFGLFRFLWHFEWSRNKQIQKFTLTSDEIRSEIENYGWVLKL